MMRLAEKGLGSWVVWVFTGLLLVLFFPTVFVGIDSFFYRDFGVLAYPIIHYQKESFLSGEIPLWNPLSHCGIPFLAQWGTMTLYPLSLFYIFLPLPWSLNVFCFLHLLIGAGGMYALTRKWIKNDAAALFSAIAFVFNGIVLSCLMWPNYTVALGWIPWIVLTAETAICFGGRYILFAIIFSVFQFMSGVPEIIFLTHIIIIAIALYKLLVRETTTLNASLRYLFILAATLLICAAQLFPFIDLFYQSHRTSDIDFTKWSMPGWGLANFFVPLFHYFKTYQNTFVQTDQAFITTYYFPLGVLVFSVVGLLYMDSKRRKLFLLLIFFSIAMALGSNSFIYKWLASYVPYFNKIRYPVKFIILLAFIIPIASAYGFAALIKKEGKVKKSIIITTIIFVLIAIFVLLFNYKYPFPLDQLGDTVKNAIYRYINLFVFISVLFAALRFINYFYLLYFSSLLIIAIDGATHLPRFHPRISSEHFRASFWKHTFESEKPTFGNGRIFISPVAEEKLLKSVVSEWTANFVGKRLAYWSNLNLMEEIPKVNGAFTLQLSHQKVIERALYQTNNIHTSGLLRYLNVKWITKPGSVVEWTKFTNSLPLVSGGQQVKMIESDKIIEYLLSPDYKPEDEIIFDKTEMGKYPLISSLTSSKVNITSVRYANHKIEIEYECEKQAVISIAQTYHRSWRLKIDGEEHPLIKANYAFQAFISPAGRHKAEIRYCEPTFNYGMLISYLGTFTVYFVFYRRKVS